MRLTRHSSGQRPEGRSETNARKTETNAHGKQKNRLNRGVIVCRGRKGSKKKNLRLSSKIPKEATRLDSKGRCRRHW